MLIESFNGKYQEEIIEMIVDIRREEFGLKANDDQPDLESISSFYQQGNGNFWIARDDNQLTGTIALIDIGSQELALRKMFVHRNYRGKEAGVAQGLMDVVFNWCREKDIETIYLGTIDTMKAAHRFYERNAFVRINKVDLPPGFPLMKVDNRFYKLSFKKNA